MMLARRLVLPLRRNVFLSCAHSSLSGGVGGGGEGLLRVELVAFKVQNLQMLSRRFGKRNFYRYFFELNY